MRVFLTGAMGGIGSTIKQAMQDHGICVISPSSSELDLSTTIFRTLGRSVKKYNQTCWWNSIQTSNYRRPVSLLSS